MQCLSCSATNSDSNRFCENCGVGLTVACPACDFECGPTARFCGGCGTPLNRPLLPLLVKAAAKPPAAVWGELKQATVLFADIVSSTEQIAKLDPEAAMERLQPAVQIMCDAIERFGGTVVRTLGDGVMALFGVPRALEGHAALACEAALSMQNSFANNSQCLSIRVGLHSGQVASDPHSADGSRGGGAHGLTVHLASRVVTVAEPGGIALTGDCYALIRPSFEVSPMGHQALKGIAEPVEIYALTGLKPAFASQHFHQAALTPFRGRAHELGLLQHAQRLTEHGETKVVGISGAPGTGKSRLCYEFAQWCRARSIPVFEVRAQLYGNATPLQPVLELLRTFFFLISPADDPATARGRILERLSELGSPVASDLALLNDFLGVAEVDGHSSPLNPKARRARLLNITRELVKHSAATTSVILIEDLHWLDEASEEFVATLVEAVAGTRTMLVLNYRPSYHSPWIQLPNFQQIDLTELSAAETDALVRELISHRRELHEISQLVAKRSGGNPFFAEELVRSLVESGVLSGEPGSTRNGLESVERALPATVQAVIGARIDRLGEAEKTLLQMCAIIGKEIPLAVLEQVAGSLNDEMDRALDGLCHAELIQPQPAAGGRRFAFRHPLIQEVAYSTQLKARRGAIHASVAKAMEHYYNEQLDEFAGLIAHHYESAGQPLNAAGYAGRAAQWVGSTDSAQAIKHWHKVRSLLHGQSHDVDSDRLRAMACSQISLLGWREGLSLEEVQPFIDEAMDLASKVDSRLTQLLLMIEGRMLQASGGPADWYVERMQQALSLVPEGTDHGRAATLNAALSQAYGWAGLLEQGLAANDAALIGIKSIDKFDREFMGFSVEQWLLGLRGRLLTRLGRFEEAQTCLQQMVSEGEFSIDPTVLQIAHHGFVDLACGREDAALAQEHAARITTLNEKHAIPYLRAFALSSRGMAATVANDFPGALASFTEALTLVRTANVAPEYETEILASIAECLRRVGELDRCLSFASETVELSRQRSTRLPECRALITYGAALIDINGSSGASEASGKFDEAEKLIQLTGARIFEAALQGERNRLRMLVDGVRPATASA